MTSYMFQFELPSEYSPEMAAIIPRHREHINRLFLKGSIISYSISQLKTSLWCIVVADSEQEAMEIVACFPLHPYFLDVLCNPLMLHNTVPNVLPEISLN